MRLSKINATSAVALSGSKVYTIDKEEYRVAVAPVVWNRNATASLLPGSAVAFLYDEDYQ
jgi:hypothetical protein